MKLKIPSIDYNYPKSFDKMAIGYDERNYIKYGKNCHSYNIYTRYKIVRSILTNYKNNLSLDDSIKLMDIGCGSGRLVNYSNSIGFVSFGIDISSDMLKNAKKNIFNNAELKRLFIRSDASVLPLKDKSFHIVISLGTIEYLVNPVEIFTEIKRILKPPSYFIFSIPISNSFLINTKNMIYRYLISNNNNTLSKQYKPDNIYVLMKNLGFKIHMVRFFHYTLFPIDFFFPQFSIKISNKLNSDIPQNNFFARKFAKSMLLITQYL